MGTASSFHSNRKATEQSRSKPDLGLHQTMSLTSLKILFPHVRARRPGRRGGHRKLSISPHLTDSHIKPNLLTSQSTQEPDTNVSFIVTAARKGVQAVAVKIADPPKKEEDGHNGVVSGFGDLQVSDPTDAPAYDPWGPA